MPEVPSENSAPALGPAFQEDMQSTEANPSTSARAVFKEEEAKSGKRRFWNLGKKKDEARAKQNTEDAQAVGLSQSPLLGSSPMRTSSPSSGPMGVPTFSKNTSHPYASTSPVRNIHSSSPAPPSPASSQIFERHVQEDSLAIREQAPIPGHITTENHIPPVLDASSEAITNDELDPDQVEIVMHSAHQPASVTVTGAPASEAGGLAPLDEQEVNAETEDGASTYGALDSTDVRRLSFISFADVVHAENVHEGGSIATGTISPTSFPNRSPSPIRSPVLAQTGSGSPALSGLDAPPSGIGMTLMSPIPGHSSPSGGGGELTIETMRQALRKTGSGDLSGARSASLSNMAHNDRQ